MRFVLMSNTRRKLEAAKYHLRRMRETQSSFDIHIFENELDAFLSAARSVTNLPVERGKKDLWYLEKEFGHRPDFQKWYDEKVGELAADSTMKFINDERAIVVHFNSQSAHRRIETRLASTDDAIACESVTTATIHVDGRTETFAPPTLPLLEKPSVASMERVWYFDTNEIPGDKTVITVCEQHVRKLEKLLNEAERL